VHLRRSRPERNFASVLALEAEHESGKVLFTYMGRLPRGLCMAHALYLTHKNVLSFKGLVKCGPKDKVIYFRCSYIETNKLFYFIKCRGVKIV
jgi:hypothetical protein